MKVLNLLIVCFLILTSHYLLGQEEKNTWLTISPKENNCKTERRFGEIAVCMVEIDGMTECYSNPTFQDFANNFKMPENIVLAWYLNNKTYSQIDRLGEFQFDDYIKVYATKALMGYYIGITELDQLKAMMEVDYIRGNWQEMKTNIENQTPHLSYGKPVLIESYQPHDKIRSFVLLSKIQSVNKEKILIMILNITEIKHRLINYGYYLEYDGEESIKRAKSKSDYFGLLLVNENM